MALGLVGRPGSSSVESLQDSEERDFESEVSTGRYY